MKNRCSSSSTHVSTHDSRRHKKSPSKRLCRIAEFRNQWVTRSPPFSTSFRQILTANCTWNSIFIRLNRKTSVEKFPNVQLFFWTVWPLIWTQSGKLFTPIVSLRSRPSTDGFTESTQYACHAIRWMKRHEFARHSRASQNTPFRWSLRVYQPTARAL
jgi:hypothetical protein